MRVTANEEVTISPLESLSGVKCMFLKMDLFQTKTTRNMHVLWMVSLSSISQGMKVPRAFHLLWKHYMLIEYWLSYLSKSKLSDDSLSAVIHSQAVTISCRMATSDDVERRIPDIH